MFVGLGTAVTCANTGANVSIPFTVTVLSILLSPSVILIVHVSIPTWFALGVYVILSHAITNVHFVQLVITLAVTLSQAHAAADDNVFQLNVFAQLQIFVQYVKLLAVTATLL